jgi:hypothetical protein
MATRARNRHIHAPRICKEANLARSIAAGAAANRPQSQRLLSTSRAQHITCAACSCKYICGTNQLRAHSAISWSPQRLAYPRPVVCQPR